MSRVGKKILTVPAGVDLKIDGQTVRVKGPKGELSLTLHPHVTVQQDGGEVRVSILDENNVKDNALWGLFRRLIENMIIGVSRGFERKLEINGVGYRAAVVGKVLRLEVGYSHDVDFEIPAGIAIAVDKNIITISGIDKQRVGEVAAQIRKVRKPEPYLGKGIKYLEEVIVRKAGKAAKAGS